jgi:hypothetical protein
MKFGADSHDSFQVPDHPEKEVAKPAARSAWGWVSRAPVWTTAVLPPNGGSINSHVFDEGILRTRHRPLATQI